MPPVERTCPDCRSPMVAGVVVDYNRGITRPSEWVESGLRTSMWTGGVQNEVRYEIDAWRCSGCGLLKLYADSPPSGAAG